MKAKAERDLGRLREQLQLAHEALGESTPEEVQRGGYGKTSQHVIWIMNFPSTALQDYTNYTCCILLCLLGELDVFVYFFLDIMKSKSNPDILKMAAAAAKRSERTMRSKVQIFKQKCCFGKNRSFYLRVAKLIP